MTAQEKISKARVGLILDNPFFGSLALRLDLTRDTSCQTGWTDGKRLGFNPQWINDLSLEQVKGFVCHEILHNALAHTTRRQNREAQKWNIACDYVINPIITDSGFVLPNNGLISSQYADMSAEAIYNTLPDSDDNSNADVGGCGEVRDAQNSNGQPLSQPDSNQLEQDWKIAVSQAAQYAKTMGELPLQIAKLIEQVLEPKIDWREVLRRFVERSAKNDYTWMQPNRRYVVHGLYLPSLKSEELPPIVIGVDTSGSIASDELNQFAAEITGILQDYQTSCTVIYCDSIVQYVEEFSSDSLPLQLSPKGGGGTNFEPVFQYVEKHNIQPSCLIYLTDIEGTFPADIPYYPVLWIQTGTCKIIPPFGELVKL